MKKLFSLFVSVLLMSTIAAVAQTGEDFTDRIVNPSFETGDITGWKKCDKGGDHDVRSNGDATYTVSNCDGAYLFNSWYSSNGHLYPAPDQWVEQTVSNLPAGEYRLMALVTSDNGKTPVELYANDASIGCIPEVKTKFVELELPVFIEPSTVSMRLGVRSAGWFKCDHFRLYYLGKTDDYKAAIGEIDGTQGLKPSLVEYFYGFVTDGWTITKLPGHDHGNFPLSTNNVDQTPFESSEMNYWTGGSNRLGDATILYSYEGLPAGWYEFDTPVRVYDENGDFDGTASGLYMRCGNQVLPITDGHLINEDYLAGMGFTGHYSLMAEVGDDGKLDIGFETTSASFNWVCWVQSRLLYYGTKKPVSTTAFKRIETLASLAEQVVDPSPFTPVYQQAIQDLKTAETEEQANAIVNTVRNAVLQLVKTGESKTSLFDLTPLIVNADITEGADGWTVVNGSMTTSMQGAGMLSDTRRQATVSQVLADMPAGHYTLSAQGFYRGRTMSEYIRNYEKGIEDHKATLFINDADIPLQSLMSGGRFIPQASNGIQTTIEGRGVPGSIASISACFALGDYWNTVDATLDADGDLTLGIGVKATSLSDNMTAFSHFRLLYGNTVPEVTLSDDDTEYSISVPTKAHVILQKKFTAGVLTPLCVPFDITAADFAELYCVGALKDKTAVIYPVNHVRAGVPCVVKTNETVDAIDFGVVTLSPVTPDTYMLPWNGGWLETFYIKENRREANYTWKYMPQAKGSSLTVSTSLTFYVTEPQRMEFTATLENLSARKFLSENLYSMSGSSYIDNYRKMTPPQRRDTPNPVMVPVGITDATDIYVEYSEDKSFASSARRGVVPGADCYLPNLYPQRTYYYRVVADGTTRQQGCFHTDGRLRMIYAPTANNVRDLGGWLTDDRTKRVTYGHIYRGSELNGDHTANAGDLQVLRDLGIASEIDLRWEGESSGAGGQSAFGFTDTFYFANGNDWTAEDLNNEVSINNWRKEWALTLQTLRAGKSMYFHCVWGADRTGLWAMLQEGILGLGFDAIFKDFELTSYSIAGARYHDQWKDRISVINALEGRTLTDKFENYFRNTLQIPQEEIDYFRSVMLEDATMQPVVISEDEDYESLQAGKTDVTLVCTLQPGQRNAVVLPFALTSAVIRKLFGSGTLIESITGFDGKELQTKKVYATTANVPFLITPATVSDNNTYEVTGVTLESGGALSTPFTGGRFSGNYETDFDVEQAVEAGHTGYVLNVPAFYATDTTTPKLKSLHAYLVLDTPSDDATRGIIFFDGETPTGISSKNNEQLTIHNDAVYDLSGRRVAQPTKGLYIVNGKKILVK